MNCKRCGNEIVGEIQRYCNDCKIEINGEPREKKLSRKSFKKEKLEIEAEEVNEVEARKRTPLATIGYILLILFIMLIVFLGSIVVGFSIGPLLSF